ncbi:Notchless protein [Thelohanellus kitauei]|uniref:Notchless protein n=1 Tax=Thelohanellus kitauei TaxID=669202 RepID=A0A0C2MNF6_THEKT|nr:Notchless protein [Thelohanellus kitauei]
MPCLFLITDEKSFQNDTRTSRDMISVPIIIQFDISFSLTVTNNDPFRVVKFTDSNNQYDFYIKDIEITNSIGDSLDQLNLSFESLIDIRCRLRSVAPAKTITRCTSSLPGHSVSIITLCFSPDARYLATGSGDNTLRIWDVLTETPLFVFNGHKNWVLATAWSHDSQMVVSGDKDGSIVIWDLQKGEQKYPSFQKHTKWITYICFEPLHLFNGKHRFASSSKDGSVIIWNASNGSMIHKMNIHMECVSCVKWSGEGLVYSSSHDLTIAISNPEIGNLVQQLKGHSHWVNFLTLNTERFLNSFDLPNTHEVNEGRVKTALNKYNQFKKNHPEVFISCSDDFSMILWKKTDKNYDSVKLIGHQAVINHVAFSPDASLVASASFDKSIKLWNGVSGNSSADSTIKMWDVMSKTMTNSLHGHNDEVAFNDNMRYMHWTGHRMEARLLLEVKMAFLKYGDKILSSLFYCRLSVPIFDWSLLIINDPT